MKAKNFPNSNARSSVSKNKSKKGGKKIEKPTKLCSGCGAKHWKEDCPFPKAECYLCKKIGHIAKVCFNKVKMKAANLVSESSNVSSIEFSKTVEISGKDISHEYIFSTCTRSSNI